MMLWSSMYTKMVERVNWCVALENEKQTNSCQKTDQTGYPLTINKEKRKQLLIHSINIFILY